MSGELKEARADLRQAQAVITDLTRKAARAEGLDALLAVEREHIADLRADMDRWRSQAEKARRHHPRTEIGAFVVAVAVERVNGHALELRDQRVRVLNRAPALARSGQHPDTRAAASN